jgi:hypothetical protein
MKTTRNSHVVSPLATYPDRDITASISSYKAGGPSFGRSVDREVDPIISPCVGIQKPRSRGGGRDQIWSHVRYLNWKERRSKRSNCA